MPNGHANDNHRTWLDGIVARYPGRVALVSFLISIPAGMLLFSGLARLLR